MSAQYHDQSFTFPNLNSVNRVLRQLKKEESSLFNCVCSVSSDAAFTDEVSRLHPGLPIAANLRCGLWYVRDPQTTCYFKSTDGHNGNWSFSTTRLNIHVAESAANHGGCVIVDATRRGKSFPVKPPPVIPFPCSFCKLPTLSKQPHKRLLALVIDVLHFAGLVDQDNPHLGNCLEQGCSTAVQLPRQHQTCQRQCLCDIIIPKECSIKTQTPQPFEKHTSKRRACCKGKGRASGPRCQNCKH